MMSFLDKAKEAATQAAAKAQQQVATMQQQASAHKAAGAASTGRDALLRDLGAAYLALRQGAGSQEAVDAAVSAVEAHDTQAATPMGDLSTVGDSSSPVPPVPPAAPGPPAPPAPPAGGFTLDDM
jgi:hypothetical protein